MARKLSPGVHNIRIKKPGGGTRMQRVKVLASGKFKFIKNKPGARASPKAKPKKSKPKSRKTPTKVGGGSTGRRRQGIASKVTSFIALIVGLSPIFKAFQTGAGNMTVFANEVQRMYTGVDRTGKFNPANLLEGYAPIAGAIAFKKGIGALMRAAPIKI